MSVPSNGTKTRVMGFLKGLFGKGNADSVRTEDEAAYDYNQVTPVTGAQLRAPVPSAMPAPKRSNGSKSANVQTSHKDSNHHTIRVPVATAPPTARQDVNINGFTVNGHSTGHVNGVVIAQNGAASKPALQTIVAPTSPTPVSLTRKSNGTGSHAPSTPAPTSFSNPARKCIQLPLAALIATLPLELQARVIKKEIGNLSVTVPIEPVLAQLSTGVVKIPFATLRESAPQFFRPADETDQTLVTLPLGEVLRQISPAQLAKPENQVRITADADVTSPFADKGNNANLEVKGSAPARTISPETTKPTPTRHNLSEVAKSSAPTANLTAPTRINVPATPAPAPRAATAPATPAATNAPLAMPKVPAPIPSQATPPLPPAPANLRAPASARAPIPMPRPQATSPAPASTPAPVTQPTPTIKGAGSLRMVSSPSESPSNPAAVPPPATAAPTTKSASVEGTLTVALMSLVDGWTDALKQEILDHNLTNGRVDLPLDAVATQLKNGRVAFQWNLIRSWLSPNPEVGSPLGDQEVELPLKVMAPLFLGLANADSTKSKRLTADDHIPNVFAQASKQATSTTPAAAPTVNPPQPLPVPVAPPAAMTPDAVVKRAAALQGVAGALVALPDGLVVASKLPAGLNGDSLAAFLPQIYAKFDVCLKDLSMDGLNNLNFTAGNVPWRVYRTSSVFFVAFGRANEPLPGDWLATLSGELEKK